MADPAESEEEMDHNKLDDEVKAQLKKDGVFIEPSLNMEVSWDNIDEVFKACKKSKIYKNMTYDKILETVERMLGTDPRKASNLRMTRCRGLPRTVRTMMTEEDEEEAEHGYRGHGSHDPRD